MSVTRPVVDTSAGEQETAVGREYIAALAGLDFERLQACFHPEVKFRALVPSGLREARSATEAVGWVRHWFSAVYELGVVHSAVDVMSDRLYIAYRLRLREQMDWQVVEQQAYCTVQDGRITAMNLLCSGFRPEPAGERHEPPDESPDSVHADAHYDAGERGCAEGPLDEIAQLMRGLAPGQTLEVTANDPSVRKDLPAWCRLVGHAVVAQDGNRYLIRHK